MDNLSGCDETESSNHRRAGVGRSGRHCGRVVGGRSLVGSEVLADCGEGMQINQTRPNSSPTGVSIASATSMRRSTTSGSRPPANDLNPPEGRMLGFRAGIAAVTIG
jgi:hypothetical protein